jgi:diguanylate cyclase (GGDEF)-like protein
MSTALRSIPRSSSPSVSRRSVFALALLLATFVVMPSLARALETLMSPLAAAITGQAAEIAIGGAIAVWVFRLIRRHDGLAQRHATELEQLTEADALTGLGNGHALRRELEEAFNRARRTHEPVTVMYVDIDALDGVNRRLGRAAGDHALRTMGAVVRSSVRFGLDVGYRVAGDEFALRLAGDREAAQAVCRRLEWTFRERTSSRAQIRVGFATWDGRSGPDRLIDAARQALAAQRQMAMVAQMA